MYWYVKIEYFIGFLVDIEFEIIVYKNVCSRCYLKCCNVDVVG